MSKELATTQAAKELQLNQKSVVDFVAGKVNEFVSNGELALPPGYSPHNAMKQAWLMLQEKPELLKCTNNSVANALLSMTVQGLNPGKQQCYFIAYGQSLACQRSYFGSMAVAKMVNPDIEEFSYAVVYEKDVFTYGIINGKKAVTKHEQSLDNIDKKSIKAAYCIAMNKSGEPIRTEIMTMEEIKQAWKQSKMKPVNDKGDITPGSVHGKFTTDMSLKTIINKTCKVIINSSNDGSVLLTTIKKSDDMIDQAVVEEDITSKANTGPVMKIEDTARPTETEPEQETPEIVAKHPAYDLCIEKRDCKKYEGVSDCPNAAVEGVRNKCVHGMELEKKKATDDLGPVPCPNDNDTMTPWSVCAGCSELKECPVR